LSDDTQVQFLVWLHAPPFFFFASGVENDNLVHSSFYTRTTIFCTPEGLLVKIVLAATPTYFLTMLKMSKWARSRIDIFRRSFS
jgi:hypothetical protein